MDSFIMFELKIELIFLGAFVPIIILEASCPLIVFFVWNYSTKSLLDHQCVYLIPALRQLPRVLPVMARLKIVFSL